MTEQTLLALMLPVAVLLLCIAALITPKFSRVLVIAALVLASGTCLWVLLA